MFEKQNKVFSVAGDFSGCSEAILGFLKMQVKSLEHQILDYLMFMHSEH